MKTKREGPRYTVERLACDSYTNAWGVWDQKLGDFLEHAPGLKEAHEWLAEALNAGERAKAELKHLRAIEKHLRQGCDLTVGGGDGYLWWCMQCGVGGS